MLVRYEIVGVSHRTTLEMGPLEKGMRLGHRGLSSVLRKKQQRLFHSNEPENHVMLGRSVQSSRCLLHDGRPVSLSVGAQDSNKAYQNILQVLRKGSCFFTLLGSLSLLQLRLAVPSARPALLKDVFGHNPFGLCGFSSVTLANLGGSSGAETKANPYEIKVEHVTRAGKPPSDSKASPPSQPERVAAITAGSDSTHPEDTPAPRPPSRVPTSFEGMTEEKKEQTIRELENELEKADVRLLKAQEQIRDLEKYLVKLVFNAEDLIERMRKEAEMTQKFAIQGFATDLTEVADNLDRALFAVPGDPEQILDDPKTCARIVRKLLEGVRLTQQRFVQVYEKHGVKKFVPTGEPFDPRYHEAIAVKDDPSKPPGLIVDVLAPGYMLHDRVIRPAQVMVVKLMTEQPA